MKFLKDKGFAIVASGWRTRFGEIDLIAKNREYVVFVEVKLRKSASFAYAREFVSMSKQGKIRKTASLWLASHKTALQPRFDVIEIYAPDEVHSPEIFHIENAF
ncbi:MAG: YraN family protein [Oscillospiraceae bacterium]|nr:YraN family protein [Oscillospiraceae bacterium]